MQLKSVTGYGSAFRFAILLSLLATLAIAAAPQYAPAVSVSPSSGPPGTTVTVNGSGFAPGFNAEIRWDGATLDSFTMPGSGSFSRSISVPGGAGAGGHTISACNYCGGGEFEESASAGFTVTNPNTQTPSSTRTRTPTPAPVFTRTSTPTLTPTPTPTEPPSVCGDLGLGPEAELFDFDGGVPASSTIDFEDSAAIEAPTAVRPHSGALAARSQIGMEFGSALRPITLVLTPKGASAVGMFVGLNSADYVDSEVTAVLRAFGYVGDSVLMTPLGSGSVSFAPVPTDIKHCLVFRAGDNEVIARLEVEYTDAAGSTLADPRWIDDVTIVWAEAPLPEDESPPVVEITLPEDGALFPGGSVDVRARVVEDRQLQEVWYEVNGGPRQDVGYTPVAGDPTLYLTGFGVGPAALTPYIENTITVWAQDRAGLQGSDTVTFSFAPPTPTPTLNLIADDVEIIQVIQCMDNPTCSDNSVPLYVGKPTLVRLYVRAEGAGAETAGIGGEICLAGACRPSLNRVTVSASEDPVRDFRGDINRTLNFLLPADWLASTGMRLFQVFINRDGRDIGECCFDDNSLERSFSFGTGRSLDVVMMRVRANGRTTAGEDRWPAIRWAQKYFPTSRINVYRSSDEPVSASYDYTTTDGWSSLLDDLWWSNYWTDDAVDWLRYHGMVPADIEFDSPGMGYRPGDESASVLLFRDGATTAHELGHNHGLAHAPSDRDAAGELTNPACGDPLGPNGRYPMYRATDGGSLPRSSIGDWAIDLYASPFKLYNPATTYDLMSYCGPRFMSLYTYSYLAGAIDRIAQVPEPAGARRALPALQGGDVLVGSGVIGPQGFDLQAGFYRRPLPADAELSPDEGPYAVELRDLAGTVLLRRAFAPRPTSDSTDPEAGHFTLIVPWVDGTALIAFLHGEQLLGGVPVSPGVPVIQLVEPNGGEAWSDDGTVRVRWEASDPDGDSLTAAVQFSADGGRTWRAVVRDVTESQARLEASLIPGTSAGLVRVCVSDGVNTTCDDSDAAFRVAGKAPEVSISSPQDGGAFPTGEQVILQASASDLEDGPLAESGSYVWTSSLDGELGQGDLLWDLALSPGRHRLTLTVTDGDGLSATDSVTIFVGQEAPPSSPLGGLGLALAGLVLLGIVAVAMLIFAFRGRRFGSR